MEGSKEDMLADFKKNITDALSNANDSQTRFAAFTLHNGETGETTQAFVGSSQSTVEAAYFALRMVKEATEMPIPVVIALLLKLHEEQEEKKTKTTEPKPEYDEDFSKFLAKLSGSTGPTH